MIENYGLINDRAPHLVADLCEIICYFENREVSRGDIETFLSEQGGDGLLADLKHGDLGSAETNEIYQALSEEVFRHLTYRTKAFGAYYPFLTEGDVLVPVTEVTQQHKIYAALLAFSRLKMFSHADRSRFAADFEVLCLEASLGFTSTWKVIHFGTGGRNRGEFGKKLKVALMKLSATLREIPINQEISAISDHDVGDGGIDIIIYKEWGDPARAVPSYFAQCAAQQENWPTKKFEASALNLEKYFSFFHKPGTILFIPLCFRGVDGKWLSSDGHQTILIDRKRLVDLIEARITRGDVKEEIFEQIPQPFGLGCAVS